MAIDDDCQAVEFRKKFDAMVAVTTDVKKRYDATYTRIHLHPDPRRHHSLRGAVHGCHPRRGGSRHCGPDQASFTYVALGPRWRCCPVGRRLRGCSHRQRPRLGCWHVEHSFSCLAHTGPLLHALCPVVQQCTAHPWMLLPLRPHINGHHVAWCPVLGLNGHCRQVVDLRHHLPRHVGHHLATRSHNSCRLAGPGEPLPLQP
jgi:hypothetical protein